MPVLITNDDGVNSSSGLLAWTLDRSVSPFLDELAQDVCVKKIHESFLL